MFEVMTLVTCDGPPGGGAGVLQMTQGRRQLWRWLHTATAPGCATKNPADSLPRGSVSTALTLAGPTSVRPAGIVGILRFFFGVRRWCACDVSAVDTSDLPGLFPPRIAASRTTSLPRAPARASLSEARRQHRPLVRRRRGRRCVVGSGGRLGGLLDAAGQLGDLVEGGAPLGHEGADLLVGAHDGGVVAPAELPPDLG